MQKAELPRQHPPGATARGLAQLGWLRLRAVAGFCGDGDTQRPFPRFQLASRIRAHQSGIDTTLVHDLSNARVESANNKLRLLTRFAFRMPPSLLNRPGHPYSYAASAPSYKSSVTYDLFGRLALLAYWGLSF